MQETSLHAALKNRYTGPGDEQEASVDGYYIDVLRGKDLVEIQTRNFSALKSKLHLLLDHHRVRLVHPIPKEKWIVKLPPNGDNVLSRKRSPRKGRIEDVFWELVRIPHLIIHPNFSLEILLTREEEIWRDDGKGSWRRKGWSITDRLLLDVVESVRLDSPREYASFLPEDLPIPFTSLHFAKNRGIQRNLAGKALYCLRAIGVVEVMDRKRRGYLYRPCEE